MKIVALCLLAASPLVAASQSLRHTHHEKDRELSSENDAKIRIIGGSLASVSRFSYAVSLQDTWGHFCGGSLIAPDVVLTAAHCTGGGEYKAVIGRENIYSSNTGDVVYKKREVRHPKYDSGTTENDFALVFLTRATNADVAMAKINSRSSVPSVGQSVSVMGWGDVVAADDLMQLSEELRAVEVKAISNSVCEASSGRVNGVWDSYKNQIFDVMLCASDPNQDACQGDSGGPLVIKGSSSNGSGDTIVGLVSWGIGCASDIFPGVYSRVSEGYDWIKEEVCSGSVDPPASLCGGDSSSSSSGSGGSSSSFSSSSNTSWKTLVEEDFESGYGKFKDGGSDVAYYKSVKGRSGVVRIQAGNGRRSSFFSNNVLLNNKSYDKFKVVFSFYANSMESDDRFCLDYSVDGGTVWRKQKCWQSGTQFSNLQWYDGETVMINPSSSNFDSLIIRFRCDGNSVQDDVLFDKVEIQGQA
ncbi:hypothetical protein HJC23_003479 [Cyclotella cryptica]|uniref:Peptidase S1 domain-containing protein n=1 Tax=Cyclotella cryptica TaxID=29204 RepID=A0ABD3QT64_9STRA|eukprot:CCRYP_002629-RA/>CCRYP_002629-RA protein AED:0.05 eAED:0.05 QI:0/-1/0/1/-1/1/1/0/470